ncbi:ComEA family DNA-binding protein [Fictibacillus iocasae]|uniref:ComEA family DNA-binding protein n=1 Tax=Fictibacillus iocasae TaxID=2715437 RepID=A0ABW2NLS8_9BACL
MSKGITQKGKAWEWGNSLWMLWALVTFGLFNYISFFYIGYRVKQRKWTLAGVLYSIPFILMIIFSETTDEDHWSYGLTLAIYFICSTISFFHVFVVRKEYLLRLEKMKDSRFEEKELERLRQSIDREYAMGQHMAAAKAEEPRPLSSNPSVLDINTSSEKEIAALPMIGSILAKKAVQHKELNGGFQHFDEFCDVLQLKPHVMERVRPLVAFSAIQRPAVEGAKSGRVIDF